MVRVAEGHGASQASALPKFEPAAPAGLRRVGRGNREAAVGKLSCAFGPRSRRGAALLERVGVAQPNEMCSAASEASPLQHRVRLRPEHTLETVDKKVLQDPSLNPYP